LTPEELAAAIADLMCAQPRIRSITAVTDTHVITVEEIGLFAALTPIEPPTWGFAVSTKEIDI
jgi:hypothetical protein